MDTHGHQNISTRRFPYSDTLSTPLRLFCVFFHSTLSCQINDLLALILSWSSLGLPVLAELGH
jgi:hypothetical protein